MSRRRMAGYRSTSAVYFAAFVIAAALVCIVLPIVLTAGR